MKQFLKRLMLGVVTLAMFGCVTPLAFADNPNYYTIYLERQGGIGTPGTKHTHGNGQRNGQVAHDGAVDQRNRVAALEQCFAHHGADGKVQRVDQHQGQQQ